MHPCISWDKVVNQNPQNTLPSKINEPYEPSPRMDLYEQPSCLGSIFVSKTLRRSDQMHQLFEKSSLGMTRKLDDMIEFHKSQLKRTYMVDLECEIVRVKIPKCMAWLDDEHICDLDIMKDNVDNPSPQSTSQVLPSFEVCTLPVTYPEEVDETIGIPMEEEPLDHIKLEYLGLNTCSYDLFPSSRKFPNVDESKPQPLPNLPFLDVNLVDKIGTDPPINPYSLGTFRMKVKENQEKEKIVSKPDKNGKLPLILAEQFELKHSLINMMTSEQFFGLEKDNPHDHIRWFNKITSTIKYKDVPNSVIKLILGIGTIEVSNILILSVRNFLSIAGRAARRWLEKEPPHSITTWDDLVLKFINEFFPPSRTTNLRNEISNFQQIFDESFHEAWGRYKDLLRACPHHGFTELHQLDTFYNALNPADQDFLNAATGGNLLEKSPQDALTIIENKPKQTSVVTTAMTAMLKQLQANPPPAQVKAVEEICFTCGGAHPYYQCLAAGGNTFPEFRDNILGYVSAAAGNYNQGSGSLPSNTVANPKGELKAITTRSGLVTDGPTIATPPKSVTPEEEECVEKTYTDPDLAEYTIKVPPLPVQEPKPPIQRHFVLHTRDSPLPNIPYPSRMLKQKQQKKDDI
uniref:Reverse transcriptase domain-containing protein n=1 Tax=Tanacetum cinerariifolium TaxID=118510 RepID=A0A6L2MNC4_TANCI|nr:reverse transcriptase domain-containing protein [Tanacetum cinerariifolium]